MSEEAVAPTPETTPPEATTTSEAPKKKRRGLMITLIAVGAVLAILLGLFIYLVSPPASAEFNDPVDAPTRSTNAALYAALVAGGIPNPFVDTNQDRAYVAYNMSSANLPQADTYQRFVIGSAADASPGSEYIFAFQYFDAAPHQLWVVKMTDFLSYVHGDLSPEQFEATIQKTTF